jgi:signal transduction histidine kinase
MTARARPAKRVRLWVILALMATIGVVVMHAIHLYIGARIATRSLAREQEYLGHGIARLVASDAADPVLTHDTITLSELVERATAIHGVAYCFIVRNGEIVASSFRGGTPPALVALREKGTRGAVVVVYGGRRYLDVDEPILDGDEGAVRIGIDMTSLQSTRRSLAIPLGLLALGLIIAGTAVALLVSRTLAKPIVEIVAATDRFDPAVGAMPPIAPHGAREVATLADRFNGMMLRLRAAHEERERVRDQALANARLAALGSLVAGVAHEVNNPLASLKACVALVRDGRDPRERDGDLDLMDAALDRLRDLVRRLLDLGRPRPLELEPASLVEIAHEASELAVLSLRQRRIAIDEIVEHDGARELVLADRKEIAQALLNLLLNAAYFSQDGGRVRVRLRSRGALRGVAVEDDGPGIPEEIRNRIGEPFFTTKPRGEGTGLGLAVTRAIVDRHHGTLELEFPERGGTVATLWLPIAVRDAVTSAGVARVG